MSFKDYSRTPASNTTLGDGTYIGANMLRNKVRPALQQIAADGKELADDVASATASTDAMQARLDSLSFTVTSASGQSVTTRTLLAGIASPVAGQTAYLAESGYEGEFVFSTANHASDVTNDPTQATYVAPSSDTSGASGAWVRAPVTAARVTMADGSNVEAELSVAAHAVAATLTAKLRQRIKARADNALTYVPATASLTTASAAWVSVCSTERLLSAYSGPLLRAIPPAGGAGVDFGAGATRVRPFEIKKFRGTAVNAKSDKLYDQCGGAGDYTQTTAANRPVLHEDNTINGRQAITFAAAEAGVARLSYYLSPTLSVPKADFTAFFVMCPTASLKDQAYFRFFNGSGLVALNLFQTASTDNGRVAINNGGGDIRQSHVYIPANPHVLVIKATGGLLSLYIGNTLIAMGASAVETITGLQLGVDVSSGLYANWHFGALLIANKGLNAADHAATVAVLDDRFSLSGDYDATLIYAGTSRTASSQGDNGQSKLFLEQKYFSRNLEIINTGQDGQALSTTAANFASREATAFATNRQNILILDDDINGLGGLGTSTVPANIYANMVAIKNAAKAVDATAIVVVRTILPQTSATYVAYGRTAAAIEADRLTLNALIRANGGGFDLVIDTAANPDMGVYPTNPNDVTKYLDGLHHTALGNKLLAAPNAAPIEALAIL